MKRIFKKNQVIIASLAIMIIIAGYLNYTADKSTPVNLTANEQTVGTDAVITNTEMYGDISEEDLQSEQGIADVEVFPDEDMNTADAVAEGGAETELPDAENVGEAVLTSTSGAQAFSAAAKLKREQVRSKNEEALLAIINNTDISEDSKQEAIANMNTLTDRAEKELAAELMLEAKGFNDAVVSMNDDNVDVVIACSSISDEQKAQIEDIVTRKTGEDIKCIVITTMENEGE